LKHHALAALILLATACGMGNSVYGRPQLQFDLPDFSKTEVVDHDLGHGVHMLQSFGGNIGVLAGPEGVLLVDAEYPQLNAKVRAAVARISPLPIRYVIDTHWHWDHVGGNADFARAGAVVISSEETLRHMAEAEAAPGAPKSGPYAPDPASLPVITVSAGAKLHLAGKTAEIIHLGSVHTNGDLIVRFREADVIQTGDAFFGHFYPFIDVAHGGSVDGMIAWLDALYAMCGPNTQIIPGHGPVQHRDDVRAYRAMLSEVRARVAKAIAAGMDEDALIASHPLDDLDKSWGGDLIKQPVLLDFVYWDLKGRRG
jgi:cyclase